MLYDCAIIGGGLGGLTLSINMAKRGFRVIVFEKEKFPFHKVCGEYISNESWNYLVGLGLPLQEMGLPQIRRLVLSSPRGHIFSRPLDPGGFGISRYKIDNQLKELAVSLSVTVMESCKVENIEFENDEFRVQTGNGMFLCRICCGSFGKRSNLDMKMKRGFVKRPANALNNYIAVKYHVRLATPADTISLHNFENGYCGFSQVEDNIACVCYLTTAAKLRLHNNSIEQMEQKLLRKNPHLDEIFSRAIKLYDAPLTISQISFESKSSVEDHVLMIGDAAGLITPLCGNGMSMAMHAGKIAAEHIEVFLQGKVSRKEMEKKYQADWDAAFKQRLMTGRMIQRFFGKEWLTGFFIRAMQLFPGLADFLISKTHGKPF